MLHPSPFGLAFSAHNRASSSGHSIALDAGKTCVSMYPQASASSHWITCKKAGRECDSAFSIGSPYYYNVPVADIGTQRSAPGTPLVVGAGPRHGSESDRESGAAIAAMAIAAAAFAAIRLDVIQYPQADACGYMLPRHSPRIPSTRANILVSLDSRSLART